MRVPTASGGVRTHRPWDSDISDIFGFSITLLGVNCHLYNVPAKCQVLFTEDLETCKTQSHIFK